MTSRLNDEDREFLKTTMPKIVNEFDKACSLVDGVIERKGLKYKQVVTSAPVHLFNGGKMQHLFDINEKNLYEVQVKNSSTNLSTEIKPNGWVYEVFNIFVKVDGQCGAVVYDEEKDDCVLLTRYDDKKNRFENGSALPKGYYEMQPGNKTVYGTDKKQHHYYFEVWPRPVESDKSKNAKLRRELYSRIDAMEDKKNRLINAVFNTCEYVGAKFQCTPGVIENNIALHHEQILRAEDLYIEDGITPRKAMFRRFDGLLSQYDIGNNPRNIYNVFHDLLIADDCSIEGFIMSHNTQSMKEEPCIKIRSNVFTKTGSFEKLKKEWRRLLKAKDTNTMESLKSRIVMPRLVTDKQ